MWQQKCIHFLHHGEGRRGTSLHGRFEIIPDKGKILLKLTSGNALALNDVFHVPDIRWNLVSKSLLGKARVKIMFESNKIMLTKNDAFVRKGVCNQHYKKYGN